VPYVQDQDGVEVDGSRFTISTCVSASTGWWLSRGLDHGLRRWLWSWLGLVGAGSLHGNQDNGSGKQECVAHGTSEYSPAPVGGRIVVVLHFRSGCYSGRGAYRPANRIIEPTGSGGTMLKRFVLAFAVLALAVASAATYRSHDQPGVKP